jgi:hypothetical protein
MEKRYFKCPSQIVLSEIWWSGICRQARFIPDNPLVIEAGKLLALTNGEFFIGNKKIEGHWSDLRAEASLNEKPSTGAKA